MPHTPRVAFVGVVLAVAIQAPAPADPVAGDGFSFHAPSGWIAVTPDRREMIEHSPASVRPLLAGIDFRQIAAFVIDPVPDGFHENINVTIQPGEIPVTEVSRAELERDLPTVFARSGMTVRRVQVVRETFGENLVLAATLDLRMPGSDVDLRQWQISLPGRSRSYVLTCTARRDQFDRHEPVFRAALGSLKVARPAPRPSLWARVLVGALIGAGIVLLVARVRRRRPPSGVA